MGQRNTVASPDLWRLQLLERLYSVELVICMLAVLVVGHTRKEI